MPLPLAVFRKMVIDARHSSYRPGPDHVRRFFELTQKIAIVSSSEKDRYEQITKLALDRLSSQHIG